MTHSVFTLY